MTQSMLTPTMAAVAILALAACSPKPQATAPEAAPAATPASAPQTPITPTPVAYSPQATADWRQVVNPDDSRRLDRLAVAWRQARAEATASGDGAKVKAAGVLLSPDTALKGRLQPPPGTYRCRTIKLGSIGGQGLGYVDYPNFRCTIALTPGGDLVLTKTTGSQRVRGLLYPDTDRRLVFVGAQAWGADERGYPSYGQQSERDQVGVFERIGQNRWRLVLPWPKQESKLDVMELSR